MSTLTTPQKTILIRNFAQHLHALVMRTKHGFHTKQTIVSNLPQQVGLMLHTSDRFSTPSESDAVDEWWVDVKRIAPIMDDRF